MDHNCHIVPIIKYSRIFSGIELRCFFFSFLLQSVGLLSLVSVKAAFVQKEFFAFPATISKVYKFILCP